MQEKLQYELEIENFRRIFSDKKNLNIALYGTGQKTATLITGIRDFHIIGLLDRDENLVGKKLYEIEVITQKKAEETADLIIINTIPAYWETIYQRIKEWKIPIYYLNGMLATLKNIDYGEKKLYWKKSSKELRQKIKEYEIISFDIFDTLVMRKVFLPRDIFPIVEHKIQKKFNKKISFVENRIKAAGFLKEPNLDEIYQKIKELTGWDNTLLQYMKKCEIDTDIQLLVPRLDIVKLCNWAISEKEIYFVSDMYYSKELVHEILKLNGVRASKHQIIVSNDFRMSKMNGDLWEYYSKFYVKKKRALHIGDNEQSDGIIPLKYFIDTYSIWSANKLLENSILYKIVPEVSTLSDSLLIGLLESQLFNSPFALRKSKGKIYFQDLETAGYCLLGWVACFYLVQLFNNTNIDKKQTQLPNSKKKYLQTKEFDLKYKKETKISELIYIEISRKIVRSIVVEYNEEKREYKISKESYKKSIDTFLGRNDKILKYNNKENKNQNYFEIEHRLQKGIMKYIYDILNIKGISIDKLFTNTTFQKKIAECLVTYDFKIQDLIKTE